MDNSKAVIYARYSSDSQNVASIQQQIKACTDRALSDSRQIVHVYIDKALSGRTMDKRDGLRQLMQDATKQKFSYVYVWKYDRIARNRYDAAQLRARFKKLNIKLVSVTELVGDGPENIILESVLDGMAEYYSAQLSQNVRRGIADNARKHNANGRRIYGYRIANGRYEIDDARAQIVRALFDGAITGKTVNDTLSAFDASLWPCKSVCSTLLRNDAYIGVYRFNGIVARDAIPRIIDDSTFYQVQSIIAKRAHKRTRSNYVLSGLLYTLDGTKLKSASGTSRNGNTFKYYRDTVTHSWYRTEMIEQTIFNACGACLSGEYVTRDILHTIESQTIDRDAIADLSSRLELAKLEYSNILELASKTIVDDIILSKVETIAQTVRTLQQSLSTLTDRQDHTRTIQAIRQASKVSLEKLLPYISRVFISGDGHVFIYFCLDKIKEPPKYLDGSTLFAVVRHTGFKNSTNEFIPFYVVLRDALVVLTVIKTAGKRGR